MYHIVMVKDPYSECGPYLLAFKRNTGEEHPDSIITRVEKVIEEVKERFDDYQWDDLLNGLEKEFGEQFVGEIDHGEVFW